MFYKLDNDGDGIVDYMEMSNCFMPRSHEYAHLVQTRGGFYKNEKDYTKFFEGKTRVLLKDFLSGYIHCEMEIELARQKICNKLRINN